MDYVSDAEGDESEIDAQPAETVEELEREDGEVLTPVTSDGADDVNDDADLRLDGGPDPDSSAPEPQVIAEAPKKRAPRAKKPAAAKKPTTRKKPAE